MRMFPWVSVKAPQSSVSEFEEGFADDLSAVEQPEVIHRHNPQIPPGVVRIRSINAQSRGVCSSR